MTEHMDSGDRSGAGEPSPESDAGEHRPGATHGATHADDGLRPETVAVTAGRDTSAGGPLNVPPTFASTFRDGDTVTYGRWENPTWSAFEDALGALEGGRAVAFSCGQAATAAVLSTLGPRTTVVYPSGSYLGTRDLLAHGVSRDHLQALAVDVTDTGAVVGALEGLARQGAAACVWLESPTNPTLGVADLPAVLEAAGRLGMASVVDNTFATPLVQHPLAWGATFVVHSATKYIGGHSDLLLGAAVTAAPERHAALLAHRTREGSVPGVMEAFLALRGLRTLPVRMERQQQTAAVLAARLEDHPAVHRVRYPGLPSHPQHDRARMQMKGFGAIVSFEVDGAGTADRLVAALHLAVPTTSLGGVETTIERRARWPGDADVAPGLLRLSVGLEHVDDLWQDLAGALDLAGRPGR